MGYNLRCEVMLVGLVTTAVNVAHACQSFFFFLSQSYPQKVSHKRQVVD